MKKICVLLCVVLALLGSCSDLSMNNEEALKASLPSDFNWETYKEINNDVAMSQIIIDLNGKRGADSLNNCVNILSDIGLAEIVYLNYLQCPEQSWNKDERCSGKFGNNSGYSKATTKWNEDAEKLDTISWQCVIGTCWSRGWSELKDSLEDPEISKVGLPIIKTMCQFVPDPEAVGKDPRSYLEEFNFDATLIERHYHYFGRYDGRPYKYCELGHFDIEKPKTQALAEKRGTYYDYGRYTFCFNRNDENVYVAQ